MITVLYLKVLFGNVSLEDNKKYASDNAFGASLANKLINLMKFHKKNQPKIPAIIKCFPTNTSLQRGMQAQTLPDEAPPIG